MLLLQSYLNLQFVISKNITSIGINTQIGLKQQQKLTVCHEVSKYVTYILYNPCKYAIHYHRLNTRLCEMEKQCCIPHRWAPTDHECTQVHQVFSREKQSQLAEAMWASSARRQFLLELKANFAGTLVCIIIYYGLL